MGDIIDIRTRERLPGEPAGPALPAVEAAMVPAPGDILVLACAACEGHTFILRVGGGICCAGCGLDMEGLDHYERD